MLKRGIYLYNQSKLKKISIIKSQICRIGVNFVAVSVDSLKIFNPGYSKRCPNQNLLMDFMKQ